MRRISSARAQSPGRDAAKAGFTLLEILLVLAITAITLAIALPSLRRNISQNAVQATFYDFQRQAARLRSFAYNEDQAILLVGTGQFAEDPDAEVRLAEIRFSDDDWRYTLSEPMLITAGGVCAPVTAFVFQGANPAMTLESGPDCRFVRVQP